MENSVAVAKQDDDKNSCDGDLEEIEITYKGIHEVYTIDDEGEWLEPIETYMMESYPAYYSCNVCKQTWDITELGQALAFEAVKEHFNES